MSESQSSVHEQAFESFARRAQNTLGDSIHELILFGSAARGETRGTDSDVDVFAVVETETQEEELLVLANEVGLEYGVFISVQTQTVARFEARRDHPFVRTVIEEGRRYV